MTKHVYIARTGSSRSAYHLSEECVHASDPRPVEKKIATERMGLTVCEFCSGEFEPKNKGSGERDLSLLEK